MYSKHQGQIFHTWSFLATVNCLLNENLHYPTAKQRKRQYLYIHPSNE